MRPDISVIIPVYNVAPYLSRCLESLINQTLKNIEIIAVNDGSEDASLDILLKYQKQDPRIRVITQKRLGPSCARNSGLRIARSALVAFCDADDCLVPTAYQKAVKQMTDGGVDLVNFGIQVVGHDGKECDPYYDIKYKGKIVPSEEVLLNMDMSPCNKIFRKSLLDKYHISFPAGLHFEDAYFCSIYGLFCKSFFFLPEKLYYYYRRPNSTMDRVFTRTPGLAIEHLQIAICIYQYLVENGLFQRYKHYFGKLFFSFFDFALRYESILEEQIRIYALARAFLDKEKIQFVEFPYLWHAQELLNRNAWNKKIKKYGGLVRITETPGEYCLRFLGIPLRRKKFRDSSFPRVSVIMPAYNVEKYIKEAIDSVLAQTYVNFEFIIINDGSTDNTAEIIQSYQDDRIVFINKKTNGGLVSCLNYGLDIARGAYIARMDADDISLPERLSLQVQFMDRHSRVGVLGSWFFIFGDICPRVERKPKYPGLKDMLKCSPVGHPTAMFRKSVFDKYNLRYNPDYKHAEDYELWVRACRVTKIANIQQVLLKYRWHGENVSCKHEREQIQTSLVIQQKIKKLCGDEKAVCRYNLDDTQLLSVLKSLGHFAYMPNSGNMGDMLIAKASMQWFDKNNLSWERMNLGDSPKNFVYGGGGAWLHAWINYMQPTMSIMQQARRIVILPSSFDNVPELISVLDKRFIVFCREKKSFNYLVNSHTQATILLDHDMALRLDADDVCKEPSKSIKKSVLKLKRRIRLLPFSCNLFRQDAESLGYYKTDLDLSDSLGWFSQYETRENIDFVGSGMLEMLRHFDCVRTDRLHVGIAAALTGADVCLYDNSYGKIKGVYEHSLHTLANVKFFDKTRAL